MRNYSVAEKKLPAVILVLRTLCHNIQSKLFNMHSDEALLTGRMGITKSAETPKQRRLHLSENTIGIVFKKENFNIHADALSLYIS